MAEEEEEDYGGDASSNSDHEDPFSVSLQLEFYHYSIGFFQCLTLYNNVLLTL